MKLKEELMDRAWVGNALIYALPLGLLRSESWEKLKGELIPSADTGGIPWSASRRKVE